MWQAAGGDFVAADDEKFGGDFAGGVRGWKATSKDDGYEEEGNC